MRTRLVSAMLLSLLLAGCATAPRARYSPHPAYRVATATQSSSAPIEEISPIPAVSVAAAGVQYHTVKKGETLWSISKMYGVDMDLLAGTNSISDNSSINKGQILKIPSSSGARPRTVDYHSAKKAYFSWPVRGSVISRFGDKAEGSVNKGIDICAAEGRNVSASRPGRVVYCDSYLKGFGQTVIIDHLDGYQTVYSYNSDILVKVGDTVRQNQVIAKVGQSGRAKQPMLHFEIRRDGEPQDPARYLVN